MIIYAKLGKVDPAEAPQYGGSSGHADPGTNVTAVQGRIGEAALIASFGAGFLPA